VVPWGAGQAIACGRQPTRYQVALTLKRLARMVEHDTDNLTLTAHAGLTLAEANRHVASAHQFLALGFDNEPETLGGLIATNHPVPRRLVYGDIRDQLLGLTVATPDGRLVRFGRKVIKNVAGYDMNKLYAGSAGTLGVIVEATFKLFALPDERATAMANFAEAGESAVLAAAAELYRSALAPAFLQLEGEGGRLTRLLAGFEGRAVAVRRQTADAITLMGRYGGTGGQVVPGTPRAAVFVSQPERGFHLRAGIAPGKLAWLAEQARAVAAGLAAPVTLAADYGAGLLRVALAPAETAAAGESIRRLRLALEAESGYLAIERAPVEVMEPLGPWGELGGEAKLMRALRRQMDPNETLNPGRFL
jgi:glycolate oxidase FAD binding subunit